MPQQLTGLAEIEAEVRKRQAARKVAEIIKQQQASQQLTDQPSVLDVRKETPAGAKAAPTYQQIKPEQFFIDPKVPLFQQLSEVDLFPDTPESQEIVKATGPQSIGPPPPPSKNFMLDFATPVAASAAFAGALGLTKSPMAAGAAYTTTSLAGRALKDKNEDIGFLGGQLGLEPGSIPALGADILEQAGMGRLLGGPIKTGAKALKYGEGRFLGNAPPILRDQRYLKWKPTTSEAFELKEGMPTWKSKFFHFMEDLSPSGQAESKLRSSQAIAEEGAKLFERIGYNFRADMFRDPNKMFHMMNTTTMPLMRLTPANIAELDQLFRTPRDLQKLLSHGQTQGMVNENLRQNAGAIRFAQIWQKNAIPHPKNPKQFMIDHEGFMKDFLDPRYLSANEKLYSKATMKRIEEFAIGIGTTQGGLHPHAKSMAGVVNSGLIVPGVWSAMKGTSRPFVGAVGMMIGANQIGKLLTKESTARLLINLVNDKPLGMPLKTASALIANALNGFTVAITNQANEPIGEGVVRDKEIVPYVGQ